MIAQPFAPTSLSLPFSSLRFSIIRPFLVSLDSLPSLCLRMAMIPGPLTHLFTPYCSPGPAVIRASLAISAPRERTTARAHVA